MRRWFGIVLAGALVVLPAFLAGGAGDAARLRAQEPQALTFDGEVALWSVAIKPDKTADFEQVLAKLKEALGKSEKPDAKRQAMGWKVVRGATMPDGNVVYTHMIYPVVPGADYTVMQILYDTFTDPGERQALYDLYRNAFAANLGASTGRVIADLAK